MSYAGEPPSPFGARDAFPDWGDAMRSGGEGGEGRLGVEPASSGSGGNSEAAGTDIDALARAAPAELSLSPGAWAGTPSSKPSPGARAARAARAEAACDAYFAARTADAQRRGKFDPVLASPALLARGGAGAGAEAGAGTGVALAVQQHQQRAQAHTQDASEHEHVTPHGGVVASLDGNAGSLAPAVGMGALPLAALVGDSSMDTDTEGDTHAGSESEGASASASIAGADNNEAVAAGHSHVHAETRSLALVRDMALTPPLVPALGVVHGLAGVVDVAGRDDASASVPRVRSAPAETTPRGSAASMGAGGSSGAQSSTGTVGGGGGLPLFISPGMSPIMPPAGSAHAHPDGADTHALLVPGFERSISLAGSGSTSGASSEDDAQTAAKASASVSSHTSHVQSGGSGPQTRRAQKKLFDPAAEMETDAGRSAGERVDVDSQGHARALEGPRESLNARSQGRPASPAADGQSEPPSMHAAGEDAKLKGVDGNARMRAHEGASAHTGARERPAETAANGATAAASTGVVHEADAAPAHAHARAHARAHPHAAAHTCTHSVGAHTLELFDLPVPDYALPVCGACPQCGQGLMVGKVLRAELLAAEPNARAPAQAPTQANAREHEHSRPHMQAAQAHAHAHEPASLNQILDSMLAAATRAPPPGTPPAHPRAGTHASWEDAAAAAAGAAARTGALSVTPFRRRRGEQMAAFAKAAHGAAARANQIGSARLHAHAQAHLRVGGSPPSPVLDAIRKYSAVTAASGGVSDGASADFIRAVRRAIF